jgi:GTP-binding protein
VDNFSINQLRKQNKDIIIIINKFDNYNNQPNNDFDKYGMSSLYFISCAHNFGIKNLKSIFINKIHTTNIKNDNDLSIAIFGKPNSGKSTLLNTLVGYRRSQTSSFAGTTSDFVTDSIKYKNRKIKFFDTAGIGRKSNIKSKSINYLSVKKSFENIYKVDFSIILIDAYQGLDRQDKRIIKLVSEKSKSVLIIFNKIDLISNKLEFKSSTILNIKSTISGVKNIKFFFISALIKNNSIKVLDYILDQFYLVEYKISTSKLNKWLTKVIKENQHPLIENKKVNFKYVVQVKEKPITIKIFCNFSNKLQNSYKKYLLNNFNYHFKILNQKTKFIFSSSKNPYI